MVTFICLAAFEQFKQPIRSAILIQVVDLLLIVLIDESFNGGNSGVYGAWAKQRG